jgi:hypothetical protein
MMQNFIEFHKYDTKQYKLEAKMKNVSEFRITITLNEEEYKKLKYAAEYLKKYNTDNASISKLSSKLISILVKALDERRIEERTALLSTIDKESKEKNIKAILENIQNDHIDSPKIIENLAFLSNVKKAIEKMEEDNTETIKENEKTKNKKETKKAEDKTIEEKQQKETQVQRKEKIETKTESKENKVDDEEEIIRFPDL